MTSLVNLFLPLEDLDFLVPNERVFYRRRAHWASLVYPAIETSAVVTLVCWMLIDLPGPGRSVLATLIAACALGVVGRIVFRVNWRAWRTLILLGVLVVVAIAFQLRAPALGVLAALSFITRFAVRWARWKWYRRLIVTDRRVLEVDGFFGSSVATLPLGRITDAVLTHTPLAELLGYSEFRVESAGQEQGLGRINFLDDGERFHSIVIQLAAGASQTLPLEHDAAYPPQYYDPNGV